VPNVNGTWNFCLIAATSDERRMHSSRVAGIVRMTAISSVPVRDAFSGDYHFHPIEPRDMRAYFTWKF
jgi:hypothetical protein